MKISAKTLTNRTRTVLASIVFLGEDGEQQTENLRIVYQALSIAAARELEAMNKEISDETDRVIFQLTHLIQSLPDVVDEAGDPVKVTKDFLEALDVQHLKTISEAIASDLNPNNSPSVN